ncbi:MAG TPA: hypothetical protein PK566_16635 [Pseudobacteroides sp.]|jgi:predicted S18 family serine protease|nr:hypothetical protein [Pseudobacteroides sp.]
MKLKKILVIGSLITCLSIGTFMTITNANEVSREQKKEIYNSKKNELIQLQNDLKKSKESKSEKLIEIKQTAREVQELAKEVDTDAYYRSKLKSFTNALEATIKEESISIESLSNEDAKILKKVLEEKKNLLKELKETDIQKVSNPKQKYEEFKEKVLIINSQIKE